jgi:hypothetical protein
MYLWIWSLQHLVHTFSVCFFSILLLSFFDGINMLKRCYCTRYSDTRVSLVICSFDERIGLKEVDYTNLRLSDHKKERRACVSQLRCSTFNSESDYRDSVMRYLSAVANCLLCLIVCCSPNGMQDSSIVDKCSVSFGWCAVSHAFTYIGCLCIQSNCHDRACHVSFDRLLSKHAAIERATFEFIGSMHKFRRSTEKPPP